MFYLVDATLELDGEVIWNKVIKHRTNISQINRAQQGKTSMKE
jgi:hypothetical protein